MKKNENIFISLQIQNDLKSKKLRLGVQFDKKTPNFSIQKETMVWYPTCDEIDFIAEVFQFIGGNKYPENVIEKPQTTTTPSEKIIMDNSHHSSEISIAPLEDDMAIEVTADLGSSRIRNKENDEKIFFEVDEKKIDEILNRKKQVAEEDYVTKSGEKILIEQMLKRKKKK